jgi:hypothetical protein
MDEEDFDLAALLTQLIKSEITPEAAARLFGVPQQIFNEMLTSYHDYLEGLQAQSQLSR